MSKFGVFAKILLIKVEKLRAVSNLTQSGPGFFSCLGPGEGRGGGDGPHNSKIIRGIEMKFGGIVENHKLINLV